MQGEHGEHMIAIGYGLILLWCVGRAIPSPLLVVARIGRFSYSDPLTADEGVKQKRPGKVDR